MNTKTCNNCGWVFPATYPPNTCKFCGAHFTEGICSTCGKFSTDLVYNRNICRSCSNASTNERCKKRYKRLREQTTDHYKEWLDKISKVKTPYKTLTEDQWLEACKHFGGCAMCNSDNIDARGFFIPFKEGGQYCNWNVIPLCDKCATRLRVQVNPFIKYHTTLNKRLKSTQANADALLDRIVNYLQPRLEEAMNGLK